MRPPSLRTSYAKFRQDQEGNLLVFEAILASILILGALLFYANLDTTIVSRSEFDTDTENFARDILLNIKNDPAEKPGYNNKLEQALTEAMRGDEQLIQDEINKYMPLGYKYAIMLDNGYGSLRLADNQEIAINNPINAQSGNILFAPNWTAHLDVSLKPLENPNIEKVVPGQVVGTELGTPKTATFINSAQTICSPEGSRYAPDGQEWIDIWANDSNQVPNNLPYGIWLRSTSGDSDCDNYKDAIVVTPFQDQYTHTPTYGVELVIW